ncbi:nitrous oxide reductase family maturation protein NosD [Streptomyces cellostaticus]|uniref:right-handed parallel beta-helix repeat-containing protein n=1 Tax=Streptomyces TaxID=1883 RepID=UPI0020269663|nr:right-handed parallel beta-helix repeat-containing protein [Streptomyces cellostaticus]
MKRCHIAYLACTAALLGTALGAAPSVAAHSTLVVRPGESIQKAVDAAKAGDTVLVLAGTYHGSVTIRTPRVTLRGVGSRTVIEPAAKKAVKKSAKKVTKSCAEGGNGICVLGTKTKDVKGVTVADLKVTGFSRTGVFGMATDGLTVRRVNAANNGVWGIAEERSVRSLLRDNYAHGNGDAGVFLANTIQEEAGAYDAKQTLVSHNRLEGNRIGVTVRRLRNLTVARNYVSGNCAGVFVVGDENRPKAGHLDVTANQVVANNRSCPKTERLPALKGSGIVLTGTEQTRVSRNWVIGNSGKSPLSGGIVLFKSFVGVAGTDNRVDRNVLSGNSPADLVSTETGRTNSFERNSCRASKPAGLC